MLVSRGVLLYIYISHFRVVDWCLAENVAMTFASAVREYECTEEKLTRLGLVARQPGWACKLAGVLTSVVFMVPGLMFLANSFIGCGLLLDDDQTLPAEVPVPISLREVFGMFLIAVFGRVCRLNHAVVLILFTSLLIFPVLGEVPNGFNCSALTVLESLCEFAKLSDATVGIIVAWIELALYGVIGLTFVPRSKLPSFILLVAIVLSSSVSAQNTTTTTTTAGAGDGYLAGSLQLKVAV